MIEYKKYAKFENLSEGEAEFYSDAQEMLDKHKINNIPLNKLWEDIEILSMQLPPVENDRWYFCT